MMRFTKTTYGKIGAAFVALFAIFFVALNIFRWMTNTPGSDSGPTYQITRYEGNLKLNEDNTATYTMHLRYHFSSSFNGQYVTFGTTGNLPEGFKANLVSVSGVGNAQVETEQEDDALVTRVYQAGSAGDMVNLTLTYQIQNPLFIYHDVAVLNWVPISDWEVPLHNVHFTITAPQNIASRLQANLGYLNQRVLPTKSGNTWNFAIRQIPAKADLGIFARWASSALKATGGSSNYQATFDRKADSIDRNSSLINTAIYYVLPVLLALLILLIIWRNISFVHRITPRATLDNKLRLYEAPEEMAPLLVASYVYSSDLNELPATAKTEPISFKNLMMATITDLIDRGVLSVENNVIKRTESQTLLPSEAQALELVMGGRQQINFEDAFQDYKMTGGYGSKRDEREAGQSIKSNFDGAVEQIANTVLSDLQAKGQTSLFRKLSPKENNKLFFGDLLLYVLPVLAILFLILTANKTYLAWSLPYDLTLITAAALALPFAFTLSAVTFRLSRDGVVTPEGAQEQMKWDAFARMLREIAHLDDDRLETIKIWNRLLVFATMFGYADEVIKLINTRGIQLTGNLNNSNFAFFYPFYMGFGSNLNSTVGGFNSASNININTGGGGFGGGGGFSGGGGGGGGGAF